MTTGRKERTKACMCENIRKTMTRTGGYPEEVRQFSKERRYVLEIMKKLETKLLEVKDMKKKVKTILVFYFILRHVTIFQKSNCFLFNVFSVLCCFLKKAEISFICLIINVMNQQTL